MVRKVPAALAAHGDHRYPARSEAGALHMVDVAVLLVLLPVPVGRQLRQAAEARLALAQRLLRALQFADFRGDGDDVGFAVLHGGSLLALEKPAAAARQRHLALADDRAIRLQRLVVLGP